MVRVKPNKYVFGGRGLDRGFFKIHIMMASPKGVRKVAIKATRMPVRASTTLKAFKYDQVKPFKVAIKKMVKYLHHHDRLQSLPLHCIEVAMLDYMEWRLLEDNSSRFINFTINAMNIIDFHNN